MEIRTEHRTVTVHELTVGQMREYLAQAESQRQVLLDPVIDLLFEDCSLRDVVAMTDLELPDFDTMTPADIQQVIDACRERNPHFFGMARRSRELIERLASQTSTAALLSSPPLGTRPS